MALGRSNSSSDSYLEDPFNALDEQFVEQLDIFDNNAKQLFTVLAGLNPFEYFPLIKSCYAQLYRDYLILNTIVAKIEKLTKSKTVVENYGIVRAECYKEISQRRTILHDVNQLILLEYSIYQDYSKHPKGISPKWSLYQAAIEKILANIQAKIDKINITKQNAEKIDEESTIEFELSQLAALMTLFKNIATNTFIRLENFKKSYVLKLFLDEWQNFTNRKFIYDGLKIKDVKNNRSELIENLKIVFAQIALAHQHNNLETLPTLESRRQALEIDLNKANALLAHLEKIQPMLEFFAHSMQGLLKDISLSSKARRDKFLAFTDSETSPSSDIMLAIMAAFEDFRRLMIRTKQILIQLADEAPDSQIFIAAYYETRSFIAPEPDDKAAGSAGSGKSACTFHSIPIITSAKEARLRPATSSSQSTSPPK